VRLVNEGVLERGYWDLAREERRRRELAVVTECEARHARALGRQLEALAFPRDEPAEARPPPSQAARALLSALHDMSCSGVCVP
jgi:hypothetical protein